MTEPPCDLLIIGAGPAGMQAAVTAARHGLGVVVADENPAPGGQIYRNAHARHASLTHVLGPDDAAGRDLAAAFAASGAKHMAGATAFMIERAGPDGFDVGLLSPAGARMHRARKVLIATGALERPFPISGWTLPGVMTAGAAQTLLKSGGIVPEGPTVLAGTGPLLYLLAAQYARAGVRLEALLDTTPRGNWLGALPHLPEFLTSPYVAKGLRLLREAHAAHRIIRHVSDLAAHGDGSLSHVTATAGGRPFRFEARVLLLHQGVVPQVNLAMASGAAHDWQAERLAFEPRLSADGESSVPGLFIAGDSAGIGGADVARHSGEVTVLAILNALGRSNAQRATEARATLARKLRGRRFLDRLHRPAPSFRMPADDVIICRCEEITAGEIRRLTTRGAQGPNQIKAFCRAGMGPCQGRSCALTVTELMAHQSGKTPEDIGHMRLRAPVKPLTVGQMAAMAGDDT
jgi:NADPH-dependent 2,4-dienoyl-CoA reductase/sulfur reductase-like enzyme